MKSLELTGRNAIKLVVEEASDNERCLVRSTTGYKALATEGNQALTWSPGIVTAVSPLTVFGLGDVDLEGKDARLGAQGELATIKDYDWTPELIDGLGYCSNGANFYAIGPNATDTAMVALYSAGGASWKRLAAPAFSSRSNPALICSETDIWVCGGQNPDTTYSGEVWHGEFGTDGSITWDVAAVGTIDSFKQSPCLAAYHPSGWVLTVDGLYDLADCSVIDTFANAFPLTGAIGYDKYRHIAWGSYAGERQEKIVSDTAIVTEDYPTFGYCYERTTAATYWLVYHGMSGAAQAVLCYDENGEQMIPFEVELYSSFTRIYFATAVKGRAFILRGQAKTGAVWTVTGDLNATSGYSSFMCVGENGALLDPEVTDADELTFTESTAGVVVLFTAPADTIYGREHLALRDEASPSLTMSCDAYLSAAPLSFVRDPGTNWKELIIPKTTTYGFKTQTITLAEEVASTLSFTCIDLRNVNRLDDADPYDEGALQYAANGNSFIQAIISAGSLYISENYGLSWAQQLFTGGLPASEEGTIHAYDSIIASIEGGQYLSTDLGASFTDVGSFGSAELTFWGTVGLEVNDYVYIYNRAADTIAEDISAGAIYDRNESEHVLPLRIAPSSVSDTLIEITMPTGFRAIKDLELVDSWLYLYRSGVWHDGVRIAENSSSGQSLFIRTKTPADYVSGDVIQIVRPLKEGKYYYSVISKDPANQYTILHASDGTVLVPEQSEATYAELLYQLQLPTEIQALNPENQKRMDLLAAELNRQRVESGIRFNDARTLPRDILRECSSVIDDSLGDEDSRQLLSGIFNVYRNGPTINGVKELARLILGDDSVVVGQTGGNLELDLTSLGTTSFSYDDSTMSVYDSWSLAIPLSTLPLAVKTLKHQYLYIVRPTILSGPMLITDHVYDSVASSVIVNYSENDILTANPVDGDLILFVDYTVMLRLSKFLKMLDELLPETVSIVY